MRLADRHVRLPPNPAARVRGALARRPWLFWLFIVAVAAVTGSVVHDSVRAVEEQRQAWGATATVYVATRTLGAGDPVDGATVARDVPEAVVPDDAMDAVPDGALARHDIGPGEMLSAHDITGREGDGGLVPARWRTVAVVEPIPTGAPIGATVTVAADGAVLADEAIVVGQRDDAVLVAVPDDDAPAVAAAAVESRAALLVGP